MRLKSIVGDITVDKLYYDHLYDVDPATGRDRIDADHVVFASLTTRTLEDPLEVYLQQPGNYRSRRTLFLALYQIESAYHYHVAVVTRDNRLLTAYRINGGSVAFKKDRHGLPVFVRY